MISPTPSEVAEMFASVTREEFAWDESKHPRDHGKFSYAAHENKAFHSASNAYSRSELAHEANEPASHLIASSGHRIAATDHRLASVAAAKAGDHDAAAFHKEMAESHTADANAHAVAAGGKSGNPHINPAANKAGDAANKSATAADHAKAADGHVNSASELSGMGSAMGGGMVEAMYDNLVSKVDSGETSEGGKQSPILQLGKAVKDRGVKVDARKMKELALGLDAVRKSRATGKDFQKAMQEVVEKSVAEAYHDNKSQAHSLRSSAYGQKEAAKKSTATAAPTPPPASVIPEDDMDRIARELREMGRGGTQETLAAIPGEEFSVRRPAQDWHMQKLLGEAAEEVF